MSLLDLCRWAIRVESSKFSGNEEMGDFLKKEFPNFSWKKISVYGNDSLFYFETNPNKSEIDLFHYSNVDTEAPFNLSLWSETNFDPLASVVKKNKLYGLGAAHSKIGILPMLLALKEAENCGDKNIVVVAGFGRDSNMRGAKRALKTIVRDRDLKKVIVSHPTRAEPCFGNVGKLKIKMFFPFSEDEKKARREHDLKENISSQSKVFSPLGREGFSSNSIVQLLKSSQNYPEGTLILDLEGGDSYETEPASTYFETDFVPEIKKSVVSKMASFAPLLEKINTNLVREFVKNKPARAIHIGKCADSIEGISFYGYCLFPSDSKEEDLDSWLNEFQVNARNVGARVKVVEYIKPYRGSDVVSNFFDIKGATLLSVTEASLFSSYCRNVLIFGPGEEALGRIPNENVSLNDLDKAYIFYKNLFSNKTGWL